MPTPTLHDRVHGGILGALVGDAVGVPYEFHAAESLPPFEELEMIPPRGFSRAHRGTPPGTYSDDGATLLCLLASLLENDGLDVDDLGRRIRAWHDEGAYAIDGVVFDVGIATRAAVRAMAAGVPAAQAGGTDERSNGNGSLMRVLPLALFHRGDDASLVELAHAQSAVTHAHPRSQVACALHGLWARRVLHDVPEPFVSATEALQSIYGASSIHRRELDEHFALDDPSPPRGSGYVVDCLRSARWAVDQGPYERVIKSAISLGDDTDTTACVAGGIAGLRDGVDAIPARWRDELRGRAIYDPLVERLASRF